LHEGHQVATFGAKRAWRVTKRFTFSQWSDDMHRKYSALILAPLLAAACTDGTAPESGTDQVSLSFSTGGTTTASTQISGDAAASGEIRIGAGNNELVITRAQVVLEEIEFESEDHSCRRRMAAAGADTVALDTARLRQYCDGFEVEFGPVVIDLPTGQGPVQGVTLRVPPGRYDELKFEIEPLDDHGGRSDDRYGRPGPRGASIRVEGTFNGQPFVYLSALEAEVELHFRPALVITPGGFNVNIRVDVSEWFTASDGRLIDPSSANAGGPNQATVEANILASLDAYPDRDRDGRRDDHSH
jgi:hypothetical protein